MFEINLVVVSIYEGRFKTQISETFQHHILVDFLHSCAHLIITSCIM